MLFKLSVGMAVFGAVLLVLQVATGGYSEHRLVLGVYGWRAYFMYAPLAFLVGSQLGRTDVLRISKLMLWLAIPIAVLVTAQFFSPQGAPINVGIAEDAELQFKGLAATGERIRPMGPFASGAAQQQFVALACAILVAFFVAPRRLPQPSFTALLLTGSGVLTCIALSGSRGTVLQCALAIAVAFGVGMVGRGAAIKGRAILWPAVLTAGALLAYPMVFPEGYAAFTERWAAADAAERRVFQETGVFGRALYGLIDFVRLIGEVPMFGYGLGFGGNAAITLRATIDGVPIGGLAETDSARHIVDLGPVLGLGYIVFRIVLAAWLTGIAFRAVRRHADPMPLLLWSYVAYVFVMGQLTGQGTINFFGWLFAGVLIAACNPSGPGLLPKVGTLSPIRKFAHSTKGTP